MIRRISLINWTVTTGLSLGVWALAAPQQALSCFIAGSLVGINLLVVIWSLKKIFQKKSIALAVSVIVIKYAVLLVLFILLYSRGWKIDFGFVIGLSSLFPTLAFIIYQYFIKSETHDSF